MPRTSRHLPALLVTFALAGCASFPGRRESEPPRNVVIVHDDTQGSDGPSAPLSVPDEAPQSDVLLGAARLVANDGRWDHRDDYGLGFGWYAGGCGLGITRRGSPLDEPALPLAVTSIRPVGSWVFVGIALGGDAVMPVLYAGDCGSRAFEGGAAARIARLAPEITGRDTSILFTTARARDPRASVATAVLGAVLGQFSGRHEGDTPRAAEPRTAQPRSAQPSSAPATTSAEPAAEPKAEPRKARASDDERPAAAPAPAAWGAGKARGASPRI